VKKRPKKRVDVHLLAIDAHVIFWSNVFCNTTLATSSVAPLQHCFYNTIFYNIISTPRTTSYLATPLQHHFCNIIFYNITSTPPLQHHLLQHHFYIPILQQHLIMLQCYNNIMLLCCNSTWFVITSNHLTTFLATLKFQLQQCSSPPTNYNYKV
jgi:hypothetical protein